MGVPRRLGLFYFISLHLLHEGGPGEFGLLSSKFPPLFGYRNGGVS
jgi:hypothetical protein